MGWGGMGSGEGGVGSGEGEVASGKRRVGWDVRAGVGEGMWDEVGIIWGVGSRV